MFLKFRFTAPTLSRSGLFFIMLLTFVFQNFASAEGTTFEVNRNTKLHIQCAQAQVKLSGTSKSDLTVLPSSSKVTLRKDPIEDLIRLVCDESDPKMVITVLGKSVPTQLNIRSGAVSIQDWTDDVHSLIEKGSFVSKKTSGFLKVFMKNGQAEIQTHGGKLKVETFNSKLSISEIEGPTDVSNFSGSTVVKNVKGDVLVNSRSGAIDITDVTGLVKYDIDNGKLNLAQVTGSIEGASDQAIVNLKLQNPVRLKAKIKNGNYKVMVPSSSGAQVYMAFEDGQFQVPSFLKQDNYGTTKTVRGTLRGGETGRLNLSGDIARVSLQTF